MEAVIGFYTYGSTGSGVLVSEEISPVLFSTYFPSYYEFLLLLQTPIRTVYYLGDVDDEKAVSLLNAHTLAVPGLGFQIVSLKV